MIKNNKAFTLIEMIISTVLAGIVIFSVYTMMLSSSRAHTKLHDASKHINSTNYFDSLIRNLADRASCVIFYEEKNRIAFIQKKGFYYDYDLDSQQIKEKSGSKKQSLYVLNLKDVSNNFVKKNTDFQRYTIRAGEVCYQFDNFFSNDNTKRNKSGREYGFSDLTQSNTKYDYDPDKFSDLYLTIYETDIDVINQPNLIKTLPFDITREELVLKNVNKIYWHGEDNDLEKESSYPFKVEAESNNLKLAIIFNTELKDGSGSETYYDSLLYYFSFNKRDDVKVISV